MITNENRAYQIGLVFFVCAVIWCFWLGARLATEKRYLAEITNCNQFLVDEGIGYGVDMVLYMRCNVVYEANGVKKLAVAVSKSPINFDADFVEKKTHVQVSFLSPHSAHLTSLPRDFTANFGAAILFGFIGWIFILKRQFSSYLFKN